MDGTSDIVQARLDAHAFMEDTCTLLAPATVVKTATGGTTRVEAAPVTSACMAVFEQGSEQLRAGGSEQLRTRDRASLYLPITTDPSSGAPVSAVAPTTLWAATYAGVHYGIEFVRPLTRHSAYLEVRLNLNA